nr:N-terminal Xaa-Pro-Lys N-methyltransferase 1-like [Ciona intestinalis]|eukprot:XP_002127135.1 N-terminal Xaa-Pro-Lys N-methyltransferase 1-like [Ciona intestinalis]
MELISGCSKVTSEEEFYCKADEYWKNIPSTLNGMLGGYGHISQIDIRGSYTFLKRFLEGPGARVKPNRALDCGAGIGRVAKHLLLPIFKTVDLAELNSNFLEQARTYLGDASSRVGNYYCCGLQDLKLKEKSYDLIWVQWVTGHLTDAHFVTFLNECKSALRKGGLIIIKDNVAILEVELDSDDSSVTRNPEELRHIYNTANMKILFEQKQTHFPPELYNVYMTALESK